MPRTGRDAIELCAQAHRHARDWSNGWTLRCGYTADDLGPQVIALGQEWRGREGFAIFYSRAETQHGFIMRAF